MKNFNKKTVITMATALCAATLVGGVMTSVNVSAEGVQTLTGFECAGASVNAQELGMRFVFNLSGDAVAKKDLTAGVVYMPYDIYSGDINVFVKGQSNALTTAFAWQDNTATADETDMIGYTYLSADVIPDTMYNRVLLVRGYIEDGENVYYTEPVKTSMAYSAWQGIATLPDYEEQLKAYMGPYTLTYEGGKVENLYYGDTVTGLPTQINGQNVEKWYWDEEKTDDIAADDYATGSMNIYYALEKFTVSGTISCADDVDMTKVKVTVDGEEKDITVAANGEYSIELDAGTKSLLRFYSDNGYVAHVKNLTVNGDVTQDITLQDGTLEAGGSAVVNGKTVNTSGWNEVGFGDSATTSADLKSIGTVATGVYSIVMPGTVTTSAYEFKTIRYTTADEQQYGIGVTNGSMSISCELRKWNGRFIVNNAGEMTVVAFYWNVAGIGWANMTMDVSADEIVWKADSPENVLGLVITLKKDGTLTITGNLTGVNDTTAVSAAAKAFFVDGQETAVVLTASDSASTALNLGTFANRWYSGMSYTVNEGYTVSGTVTVPTGVTITTLGLTADGVAVDVAYDSANGTYTAKMEAGTKSLLRFYSDNGYVAHVKNLTVNDEVTQNITLQDGTLEAGGSAVVNGKTVNTSGWNEVGFGDSATTSADLKSIGTVATGVYSIVMPGTVTTSAYEFKTIRYTTADEQQYGIGVTNGSMSISCELRKWNGRFIVNNAGEMTVVAFYWNVAGIGWANMTMDVSADEIVWKADSPENVLGLVITLKKDGTLTITGNLTGVNDTTAVSAAAKAFFVDGQETAVVLTASDSASTALNLGTFANRWYSGMSYTKKD